MFCSKGKLRHRFYPPPLSLSPKKVKHPTYMPLRLNSSMKDPVESPRPPVSSRVRCHPAPQQPGTHHWQQGVAGPLSRPPRRPLRLPPPTPPFFVYNFGLMEAAKGWEAKKIKVNYENKKLMSRGS